ncbi:hypothetical protein EC957_000576 [Mortierella hygrophila]|uniref:HCP-like protein n=1 Tax=Mortierella hygrophila TaxID=979708 RepID=A0A9P6K2T7_9FUNG|nr:hypothetical protein EC957_000576 [Mortierella hygrophila]
MVTNKPQIQAVRPVNKDNLDSPTITPAPTVYFDCYSNPATGESFVLWHDIRLVFADALYIRHEAKVVSFMKDTEWMPLKPLRIAAIPDVVLDVVVDNPLVLLEAPMQETTSASTPMEVTAQDTPQEGKRLKFPSPPVPNAPRLNPMYGSEDTVMEESYIDYPDFRPKPWVSQPSPTTEQEEDTNESTDNAPEKNSEPTKISTQANNDKSTSTSQSDQSPQDHIAVAAIRDISPIVVKAFLGDPKSQAELGDMYRFGDGVELNFREARYWYLKAAKQGDPAGQCNLGHLYRLGLGVDQNHSTALSWYRKAAHQGDAGGQCHLGLMYEYGLVGTIDRSAAMDWYMMAANQGYAFAQCCIGSLYETGQGVQQDYDKAMEWYLRAADQSLPAAQTMICHMYLIGVGVSQDRSIGLDWLSKATNRKDTDVWSQIAMGVMYMSDLSVPKRESMAFAWFLKAARQGSPGAQNVVGRMNRDGQGVPQDYRLALLWFVKSANHNYPGSQYDIGSMYLQGQGVPKSYTMAKEWYARAAKLGHDSARTKLFEVQRLIDEGTGGF